WLALTGEPWPVKLIMGVPMSRIVSTVILGLTTFALGVGLVMAQPALDPMQALRGRPAGSNPLDPMTALSSSATAAKETVATNAEFEDLPDGVGVEETYYQCVACHSTEIIKAQRVTDQRWDELWTWMVDAQGM